MSYTHDRDITLEGWIVHTSQANAKGTIKEHRNPILESRCKSKRSGRSPPEPSTAGVHIHVTTTPNSASVKSDRTEKFPSRSRLDYNEQSTPTGRFRRPFAKSVSDTRKFSMPVS